ncbi:MAG TPA: hypothetical protein DDZ76_00730 [Xanthomonadales bacterium]|nr:hypothetical protein [Xanthomonadales bacterium]
MTTFLDFQVLFIKWRASMKQQVGTRTNYFLRLQRELKPGKIKEGFALFTSILEQSANASQDITAGRCEEFGRSCQRGSVHHASGDSQACIGGALQETSNGRVLLDCSKCCRKCQDSAPIVSIRQHWSFEDGSSLAAVL